MGNQVTAGERFANTFDLIFSNEKCSTCPVRKAISDEAVVMINNGEMDGRVNYRQFDNLPLACMLVDDACILELLISAEQQAAAAHNDE